LKMLKTFSISAFCFFAFGLMLATSAGTFA
jgi:hypothetical protein